jgi:hypothetical protein
MQKHYRPCQTQHAYEYTKSPETRGAHYQKSIASVHISSLLSLGPFEYSLMENEEIEDGREKT